MQAMTIDAAGLAAMLHMKKETFLRKRARLMALGMPKPVPGAGNVWSVPLVEAWLNGEPASLDRVPRFDPAATTLDRHFETEVA